MKPSPLSRKTRLQRKSAMKRGGPIARKPSKGPKRDTPQRARKRAKDREYRKNRAAVHEATGGKCCYCGADATGGTHHEDFKSAGGGNERSNLKPACIKCHNERHGITVVDSAPMFGDRSPLRVGLNKEGKAA